MRIFRRATVQENFILLTLLPCYNVENTSIYAPSIILNGEDVLEKTRAAYYPTALRASLLYHHDKRRNSAEAISNIHEPNVILKWATGVGKSLGFIRMQMSLQPKSTYIVVAERAHIKKLD